jgi:acyl-coenzyme A thioesterase PaaI-like protein
MSQVLAAIPYAQFLGVRVERVDGQLECVLPFRDDRRHAAPAVHGGVLGAPGLTAFLRLIDERYQPVPKPITFSVDYLRSAGPADTRAQAEIFKLGRRIAHVRVVAWQDDRARLVVAGNGKFLLSG